MNKLHSDWRIFSPGWEDREAVLALMRGYDEFFSGEADTDMEDLKHDWSQITLEQDAWLAHSDRDGLIAYAAVFPQQAHGLRFDLRSDPEHLESQVPVELLRLCLLRAAERARQSPITHYRAYNLHANHIFGALFAGAGFRAGKSIYQMRKEMDGAPWEPGWPAGILTRQFMPGRDEVPTYELIQKAFERPGRKRSSFEDWKVHMLRPGIFRPDLWTLAFDGDTLVGACLAFDYPSEGWVRQLGVSAEWRGRGLGSALLHDAFAAFYREGKRRVGLTVESDNPDALGFYERSGMTLFRRYDEYTRTAPA